ncbi:uncharacterized protein LOC113519945 isoform X2 [Galleria mellonella]|uniref:Uncharacterized protein LOC113519945 isoform X2 n=1 Tax=Galleria mellonella TaxID=7137 RepID=A0A6J1WXM8_GALME|nr:uncharacterized protein LOC113519945 isoform X2 [Galleria mellonella]
MNSRSSVNETNLVNFCGSAADLTTLNQLDAKDGLLTFPFDHIYACHSESSGRRKTLQLEKEVEIATHCVITDEKDSVVNKNIDVNRLTERVAALENQNKKLKDLLIYHLDLIQQQNELISNREKLQQALKQENDTLKTKLNRRLLNQKQSVKSSPILHGSQANISSTIVKTEPGSSSQIMLNSFPDLLLPDNRANSFLFDADVNKSKSFGQDTFAAPRTSEPEVKSYLPNDLGVSSISDNKVNCDNFTMIESKRSFVDKEMKTENRSEPLYTVTSNSGNPVIQRIQRNRRRTTSGIGCLSRMSKSSGTGTKLETPESSKMFDDDKSFERSFSVNKKSKMINTYGKNKTNNPKKTTQFTGSLSDRLQLIDTTPTGEDPYQIGEAEMREQSPIPKLMLQKTNHGRMKICTDTIGESTTTSRRIYDSNINDGNSKVINKMKVDRYNLLDPYTHTKDNLKKESSKTLIVEEPDLDIVKTEPEIDWRVYNPNKTGTETSLCDFSYGENADNLASQILPNFEPVELQELFAPEFPMPLDNLNSVEYAAMEKSAASKSKKRAHSSNLIASNNTGDECLENKRTNDSKRGRKRTLLTAGLAKSIKRENSQKGIASKPKLVKGKAACRGKKSPLPGMVTNKAYHTLVGDPDLSWYYRLDPHIKYEDIETPSDSKVSTVEVPRWREKPYTSCYTLEGTENLDDKVFEKRHQKLEAEERRQLRWHMRRIREQKHVERLRQRQRDSWCSGGASPAHQQPSVFTVWPQPQRDVRFIEITDTLPVMAFGEAIPALPESDFMLPWVRTSKALKRSKRSKTLH